MTAVKLVDFLNNEVPVNLTLVVMNLVGYFHNKVSVNLTSVVIKEKTPRGPGRLSPVLYPGNLSEITAPDPAESIPWFRLLI